MTNQALFDKIDLHLIKVLHTVLTERSVSRAAIRLGMHQPAVSACLKRLRALSGDPLLVRSGAAMVPTDAALQMLEPSASILRAAQVLFSDARGFEPKTSQHTLRIAAADYLDPLFLPRLVSLLKTQAPLCPIEIYPLSPDSNYHEHLAQGRVDVVVGNWLKAPDELHMGSLLDDEIVSMVSVEHPAVRRGWDLHDWLEAEHVAPTPSHPGARGVIDEHLASMGHQRRITVRCPHFGLMPAMVASSLLVLTTGRQFCNRYLATDPRLKLLASPLDFPPLRYYQLWHERTHVSSAARWLREQVKGVAQGLKSPG